MCQPLQWLLLLLGVYICSATALASSWAAAADRIAAVVMLQSLTRKLANS